MEKVSVGQLIEVYLKQKKMSQKVLAKELGITESFVSMILNDRRNPALATLRGIVETLEIPDKDAIKLSSMCGFNMNTSADFLGVLEEYKHHNLMPMIQEIACSGCATCSLSDLRILLEIQQVLKTNGRILTRSVIKKVISVSQ